MTIDPTDLTQHTERDERVERTNMRPIEHYQKSVSTIEASATAREAALRLREGALGALVVVQEKEPVGMVTDRDLLLRVIAPGRDVARTTVEDIMSQPLASVAADAPLERVLGVMADRRVRRVAVLREGKLSGLVALDDAFAMLSDELSGLAEGMRGAFRAEQSSSRASSRRHEVESRLKDLVEQIEHLGGGARDKLMRRVEAVRQHLRAGGA